MNRKREAIEVNWSEIMSYNFNICLLLLKVYVVEVLSSVTFTLIVCRLHAGLHTTSVIEVLSQTTNEAEFILSDYSPSVASYIY